MYRRSTCVPYTRHAAMNQPADDVTPLMSYTELKSANVPLKTTWSVPGDAHTARRVRIGRGLPPDPPPRFNKKKVSKTKV